jgi:hypothetical protein
MAGTLAPFASGAEGLWWNDGVLGKPLLLSGLLGVGMEGGNNALSLSRIMGIVRNDAGAKTDAIADIRKEGKWDARIEGGGAAGVTIKGFGLGVFPHVYIEAKDVSPDAAEFALSDSVTLVPGHHYQLKGEYARAVFTEVAAGYAHDLPTFIPGVALSGGGALKYFKGSDYDQVKTNQDFYTGPSSAQSSDSTHITASSGSGYGVDLGVDASFLGIAKASLSLRNLGAKITWDKAAVQSGYFDLATLAFQSTTKLQDAEQKLPATLLLGGGVSIPVVGTSAGVLLESDFTNKETRLHLGAEQSIGGIIAFRAGYVTGAGPAPAQVTFGLGLGAVIAHVDLGAGMALNGKGGSASISANVNI